jgi:malate dehydrogenase
MLPLPRFTQIKGVALDEFLKEEKISALLKATVERGKEIVSLLGSGSAYFAPSAAIAAMARVVIKDEKRLLGACAYLDGEYGIKDVCLGVPCRLGKNGVEEIVELKLNRTEQDALQAVASALKKQYQDLPL